MDTVPISEFIAKYRLLLEQVKRTGKPLNITRCRELIAQVTPLFPPPRPASWLGCMESTVEIKGDIIGPVVSEDEWRVFNL